MAPGRLGSSMHLAHLLLLPPLAPGQRSGRRATAAGAAAGAAGGQPWHGGGAVRGPRASAAGAPGAAQGAESVGTLRENSLHLLAAVCE